MQRYSHQREVIRNYLSSRTDHPTADAVYKAIREIEPNISLGTVYRNLALLASQGEIQKISCGDGSEHFDYNAKPHYHFRCRNCGRVEDVHMEREASLEERAAAVFPGRIESHSLMFSGICGNCEAN